MRTFAATLTTTLLATTVAIATASAQSLPPRPPGQIGPSSTNPLDTGNETLPGSNPSGVTNVPQQSANTVPPPVGVPPTPQFNPGVPTGTPGYVRPGTQTGTLPGVAPTAPIRIDSNLPPPPEGATVQLPDALRPHRGGMTAESAAERALHLNWSVEGARAAVVAAEAQQAEAGRAMIPTLSASARYTRLSPYTVGTIAFPNYGAAIAGLLSTPPNTAYTQMCAPSGFQAPQCGVPLALTTAILDQYDLRVSVTLPISDIPLRLARLYEAAGLTAEAGRMQLAYQRMVQGQIARVNFYEYMRAVGNAAVADVSLDAARRRQIDIGQSVAAGTVPRAQMLAVDAQVAALVRAADVAHNNAAFMEARLRQNLHLSPDEPIVLGEALDAPVDIPTDLAQLIAHAMATRPDIRSIERQARAIDANVASTRASQFPSLTGVGNFDYLNPNTRIFPQVAAFSPTWDASIQLSWSPTQAFIADATITRLQANRAQLYAQQQAAREGAEIEVRGYYMNAVNARSQLASARAQLASAEEGYRVARERVQAGAAVATELLSAESDLMVARFQLVNASVEVREQLAQLRRAVGEPEAGTVGRGAH